MLHNGLRFNYQTPLPENNDSATRFSNVARLNHHTNTIPYSQPAHATRSFTPQCFLPIVKSIVINNETRVSVTTILDSGSELNVINSKLCEKLRLDGSSISINIVVVAGEIIRNHPKIVDLIVEDRMGYRTPIQCSVLDKTRGKALKFDSQILSSLEKSITIPKNDIYMNSGEIELLIGMTSPRLHQQISMYGEQNGMLIMETRFGPSLVGPVPNNCNGNYKCGVFNACRVSLTEEENKLLKLVEAEMAGIKKEWACQLKTEEELLFETSMKDAWTIDDTGRFEVKLPWKIDPINLRNNRIQAINRSLLLERKLLRTPDVLKLFNEQIEEMISLQVLRKTEPNYPKRYLLPLLAVMNLARQSTKVRVCLDSRTKFSRLSLNDLLLKGKLTMNDIFQTITRFRCGKYTLIGDIRKMFWQIKICEKD